MIWASGTRSLHEYIRQALGADPQLFPTLLGLRLLNDPLVGGRVGRQVESRIPVWLLPAMWPADQLEL